MPDRLAGLVERAGSPRILVVGDLILDRYVWGDVSRISPEGPIPVLRVVSEETRAGGAGNVVSNLLHLQSRAAVCGVVGDDAGGRTLTGILTGQGADPAGILPCPERPTSVKTRYMGFVQSARRAVQHMLRVDHETTRIIPPEVEDRAVAHRKPRRQAREPLALQVGERRDEIEVPVGGGHR